MFVKNITFLFLVIVFLSTVSIVSAQGVTPSVTPTPTPVAYTLPYPGILPGHSLYGLKSFRDGLMDFLISNPLKKAEHKLLQADKELQATLLLIDQDKDEKTITMTLIQAENDFEKAIMKAQEAKKQGLITDNLLERLALANKKHQEVITKIIKSSKGNIKEEASKQLERAEEFAKTVSEQDSQ